MKRRVEREIRQRNVDWKKEWKERDETNYDKNANTADVEKQVTEEMYN